MAVSLSSVVYLRGCNRVCTFCNQDYTMCQWLGFISNQIFPFLIALSCFWFCVATFFHQGQCKAFIFHHIYYILSFVYICLHLLTKSKKDKMMKSSGLLEKFRVEYNIPLLVGLHFVQDGKINLAKSSLIEGEMILSENYFEMGLKLSISSLFNNVVIFCNSH